jgi:hypothetical protein
MDREYINKKKREWYRRNIERQHEIQNAYQRIYRIAYNQINKQKLADYQREYQREYRKNHYQPKPRQIPLPRSRIKIEHKIIISFQ